MDIRLSDHFTYKKLLRFTLPSILMMIFTSTYSAVDGFFVSNFAGNTAFAALNLIYPVIMILATVGFMLGTGGTALVSKTLGEGDKQKANALFSMFTYLTFGLGVLFGVLGIIFIKPLALLLGATPELLQPCMDYAIILLIAMPFFVLQLYFHSFLVAAEKPQVGLTITITAGVCNMILDAVLVLSLPYHLKLHGAAIATAVCQTIGGVIPVIYFMVKKDCILKLGKPEFDGKAILKAFTNGSSEFMTNVSLNLVAIVYNLQLLRFAGENGVSAYGVMMYFSFFFSSTFIGYSTGTAPVFGFHFGAKNKTELRSLLAKSLKLIAVVGTSIVLISQLLALPLCKIFVGRSPELLELTVSGFRLFALCFLFMGFAIFTSGFFTALNDGLTSALISFLRTLVFQTVAVLILPEFFGITGVWLSIVVAEVLAVFVSISLTLLKRKKYGY